MTGRRLRDVRWGSRSKTWALWKRYEPGTYLKVLGAPAVVCCGSGTAWFVVLPSGVARRLSTAHTVVEHDDRSITVSPSIWDDTRTDGYHGHLTRGVWS